jgi:hypothetical protein
MAKGSQKEATLAIKAALRSSSGGFIEFFGDVGKKRGILPTGMNGRLQPG